MRSLNDMICSKCMCEKPLVDFRKQPNGDYRHKCKHCSVRVIDHCMVYRKWKLDPNNIERKKSRRRLSSIDPMRWHLKIEAKAIVSTLHSMNIKECIKCGGIFGLCEFNLYRAKPRSNCRTCEKSMRDQWRLDNPDKTRLMYTRRAMKAYHTNVQYKLRMLLRSRVRGAVKYGRSGSPVGDLGCTISELKAHLEARFEVGMSWDNHGAWHIDHIVPLKKFDLTSREQFLQACNYTNLQPLWAEDNLKKDLEYRYAAADC